MTNVHDRLDQIEGDLYRSDAENPGAIIRIDRIEQLLQTAFKIGLALGGVGIIYQAFEVVGDILRAKAHGP